jgi:hypothetical protein
LLDDIRDLCSVPVDRKSQMDSAADRVAECEHRVQLLGTIPSSEKTAADLQYAKLELTLARAELALVRMENRRFQREVERTRDLKSILDSLPAKTKPPAASDSDNLVVLVADDSNCMTHQSCSVLRAATLRVAAKEARSRGRIRAARLAVERLGTRLETLEQLDAKGLADRVELALAREELSLAKSDLSDVRAERSILRDSYRELLRSEPVGQQHCETSLPPDASAFEPDHLPVSSLVFPAAVRRIVDLRQKQCETEARRAALVAELTMLEELARRLDDVCGKFAETQNRSKESAGSDALKESLTTGAHQEQEEVRLKIASIKAELLAADELLEILQLEACRFVHQVLHQFDGRGEARVLARAGDRRGRRTRVDRRRNARLAPNYVESFGAIRLAQRCDHADPPLDLADPPTTRPLEDQLAPSHARYISTPSMDFLIGATWIKDRDGESLGLRHDEDTRPSTPSYALRIRSLHRRLSSQPRGLTYHGPRYTDYYAFGIRRTDRPASRHGRATPYGGPWYFPGAPTNFR